MDTFASNTTGGGSLSGRSTPALKFGWKEILGILALTAAAFLIHGYHPYSEDSESYLPGIEKLLNPRLFPVHPEYFAMHAHLTLFPRLIAYTVRGLHVPLPWALFLWQVLSIFLFLAACWALMRRIFTPRAACWAGLALLTALFTMPVAGTALYVMDPFLNPRNIIAFAEILAVVKVLDRRYIQAALLLVFGVSVHPLMTAYSITFCLLLIAVDRWTEWWPGKRVAQERADREQEAPAARAFFLFAPFKGLFSAPSEAYEQVAASHRYQFLARWTWYEMLGAVAPVVIFWAFGSVARARRMRNLELLSRAVAVFASIYFLVGLAVSIPHRLEVFSLWQPMRSLRLVYILMLLLGGGLLGEFVLRHRAWRWAVIFLPLCAGMCWAQRELYPASAHIEWPEAQPRNPWVQAFAWVRDHTPEDAVFAMDPRYMSAPGEDANGFRAVAQRSRLADAVKDSGVVELFPQIADSWMAQVRAQAGIDHFSQADFMRLKSQYGVNWVVLRQPGSVELECPYRNPVVMVCRLP